MKFDIDTDTALCANHPFWKAMGYDFWFKMAQEPEGKKLLDRAAEHDSIRYVRSHFTFSSRDRIADGKAGGNVCGQVVRVDDRGRTYYDFSRVNAAFREYVRRGLRPVVEFDFFPDGFSAGAGSGPAGESGPPENTILDWKRWENLLEAFMKKLLNEFGPGELEKWYFEVWNEPDSWPPGLLPQFYRMYDLFAHTVKKHGSAFRVGGPACFHLYFLKDFLDHVCRGINHVTGGKGAPIDFVSYHIYAVSGEWLNRSPELHPRVSFFVREILWWQRLIKLYPELRGVEMHLNEWGLCSHGDSRFSDEYPALEYRNSEFSALFLVKLVDCIMSIKREYGFDISMMLYWGACFNAYFPDRMFLGSRDLVTAGNVPKPVLTAFEMLALLGDKLLKVDGPAPGGRFGCIASGSEKEVQVLSYNFEETDREPEGYDNIDINIRGKRPEGMGSVHIREYKLDHRHHNTYRAWQRMGSPARPGSRLTGELMRAARIDRPDSEYEAEIKEGELTLQLRMKRHGMRLLILDM